jgi:DNA replication ATP-dependent helicase Dna2
VDFSINAGYQSAPSSYSRDLRLDFATPLPAIQPSDWPADLYWTPEWGRLLDPDYPAVCFVYPEGRSSQWNLFEADAIGALVFLLHNRMANQLLNERDPSSDEIIESGSSVPYSPTGFWSSGVGIVTPHRAQQGLVVSRLQQIFSSTAVPASVIRDAVDTVERFQGQQRDVIIATFALGDPDAIRDEDEFLMSLNRFNVMASRARAKLVVLVSRQVVDHLSGDLDTLRESRLLKVYAESFCGNVSAMSLGFVENGTQRLVPGIFKHH